MGRVGRKREVKQISAASDDTKGSEDSIAVGRVKLLIQVRVLDYLWILFMCFSTNLEEL